jgi:hypothetical protein
MSEIREGRPGRGRGPRSQRGSRYFPAANPYERLAGPPKFQFGEYGELTPKTLDQANLSGEERKRAIEMLKVQQAYLAIYQCLDYPNDPDGHVVDLSGIHMTQPKVAIAYTLALLGFRQTGRQYIKRRSITGPGVAEGAYYWVDSRASDNPLDELLPEHSADDHHLPPDTRRLAAIRDGAPGQELPQWNVRPKIVYEDVPREECGYPENARWPDTMDQP